MKANVQMEFRCVAHESRQFDCQVCSFVLSCEQKLERLRKQREETLDQITIRLMRKEVVILTVK